MAWVPLRTGVAFLSRSQEICGQCNGRYLDALAHVDDPTRHPCTRRLARATTPDDRTVRPFNPMARQDRTLFEVLMSGDHVLHGFTTASCACTSCGRISSGRRKGALNSDRVKFVGGSACRRMKDDDRARFGPISQSLNRRSLFPRDDVIRRFESDSSSTSATSWRGRPSAGGASPQLPLPRRTSADSGRRAERELSWGLVAWVLLGKKSGPPSGVTSQEACCSRRTESLALEGATRRDPRAWSLLRCEHPD
jgi:hypothetical protein